MQSKLFSAYIFKMKKTILNQFYKSRYSTTVSAYLGVVSPGKQLFY